jgi:hypothetical protein
MNGKVLYTPKGAALEYGRVGCNLYTGCPHDCSYCYLKRGAPSKQLGGTEVRLKKCFKDEADACRVLRKELDKWQTECQEHGIFLSFTTDPLIDETRSLTLTAIIEATVRDIPVWLLTKTDAFLHDYEFMTWMENVNILYRDRIHFGFTLTGCDELEQKASTNEARISAMRRMNMMGFSTWASIEPVVYWPESERMVRESVLWCDHYKLGLRSGVKKSYYNIAQSGAAVMRIVQTVESFKKTIYLKESTRKLLQQFLQPGAYESFLSHTVDMNGKPIEYQYALAY